MMKLGPMDDDHKEECPCCGEESYDADGCDNGCNSEEIGWSKGFNGDGDDDVD